jgi:hypothetical protein
MDHPFDILPYHDTRISLEQNLKNVLRLLIEDELVHLLSVCWCLKLVLVHMVIFHLGMNDVLSVIQTNDPFDAGWIIDWIAN